MILSNELRKGNCVNVNNSVAFIAQILWNRVEVEMKENDVTIYRDCDYDEIKPIELNADIILQCGFIKREQFHFSDVYVSKNEDFIINQMRDSIEISFGLKGSFAIVCNRPINLHQLQNLYFALTREEITIQYLP